MAITVQFQEAKLFKKVLIRTEKDGSIAVLPLGRRMLLIRGKTGTSNLVIGSGPTQVVVVGPYEKLRLWLEELAGLEADALA